MNKYIARIKRMLMPGYNRQYWQGYAFRLSPSTFVRTILYYVYFINTIYFSNRRISYHLFVYAPKGKDNPIDYEWEIYDKKTKEPYKLDSSTKRTGTIYFTKHENNKVYMCDGKKLEKVIDGFNFKNPVYYRVNKAIDLGYVVDDMRCYIKVKFKIGDKVFETEPMLSFNVYDTDDLQKDIFLLILGAVVGFVISLIFK